jgi:hypothetical protein
MKPLVKFKWASIFLINFRIKNGPKQSDALLPLLSISAFEYAIRTDQATQEGQNWMRLQLQIYAEGANLLEKMYIS